MRTSALQLDGINAPAFQRDFTVAAAVKQFEQPPGDAAFHVMGSVANGVLL
jgi:hypothetical protein